MANIDLHFGPKPRLHPPVSSTFRRDARLEASSAARPAAKRPKFCRLDAGQLIRSAFLVLLCLCLSQLARAEKAPGQDPAMNAQPKI